MPLVGFVGRWCTSAAVVLLFGKNAPVIECRRHHCYLPFSSLLLAVGRVGGLVSVARCFFLRRSFFIVSTLSTFPLFYSVTFVRFVKCECCGFTLTLAAAGWPVSFSIFIYF